MASRPVVDCDRWFKLGLDVAQIDLSRPGKGSSEAGLAPVNDETPGVTGGFISVGDTGIEPVTSSVSGKRATAAPIAQILQNTSHRALQAGGGYGIRTRVNGFAGRCLASRPIHRACCRTSQAELLPKRIGLSADSIRADDEIRTRDPHLGKVMRYHCATSATARISACFEDSSR